MRFLLTSVVGLVFSLLPSLASAEVSAQNTYLDRLLRIYESSRVPTVAELNGAFSGRCYRVESPNQPFGLLLVARTQAVTPEDPGHGPLFPPGPGYSRHEYNLFGRGHMGMGAPANYWDEYTPEQEESVTDAIAAGEIARSNLWQGALSAELRHRNLHFLTRLYPTDAPENGDVPGYFVTRLHVIQPDPRAPRPLMATCYFFKKVR